jgi:hypothetical protein
MKMILWWVALVVGVLGVLIFQKVINIPSLSLPSFWIVLGSAGLFAITGLFKNS